VHWLFDKLVFVPGVMLPTKPVLALFFG